MILAERKKRKLERLLKFTNLDLAMFKSLVHSFSELYANGVVRVYLSGPRVSMDIPEPNIRLLMKKFNVDRMKLRDYGEAFAFCVHYNVRKEDTELCEFLKENKDVETAEKLREKMDFVKRLLEKHPNLRQGYLSYTFSKLYNFLDVEWEADFKVFHSPSEFLRTEETPLVFPSSRLRFILSSPAIVPVEPETKSVEFEISNKDLDFLIRSLQEAREAMRNLEKKELVDREKQ